MIDWKLPNDAKFEYRPRTLKEFQGFANRPAIKKLRKATKPEWNGKLLLCGPRRSGLSTLLNLMARDANNIPASDSYFKFPSEVKWQQNKPGIKFFDGERKTFLIDAKQVSHDDLKFTLSNLFFTGKRYTLVDNLEAITDAAILSRFCSYFHQTEDDIIVAVHYEESRPELRERLWGDLKLGLKTIPITYPETDSVQRLHDQLAELGEIEAWSSMIDLSQGDLTKFIWLLGEGGDRGMLDYIDKIEDLIWPASERNSSTDEPSVST
ncbi:MAG: hypothetical protein QM811_13450 [Pirellulales bacterium]